MGINFPLWSPSIGDVAPAVINELLGPDSVSTTQITTVGNATLPAAAMLGGQISRTGPTSAFTDTTDTAAAIVAAQGAFESGATFTIRYKNQSAFPATLAGGTGVTMSSVTLVPAGFLGSYYATIGGTQASPTVTFSHISTDVVTPHGGTFVALTGGGPVTVADANVTATSAIIITLKTVGGIVGAIPHLATITPGTGFTVVNTTTDTSTYNYLIIG
jgi:hypothetical protein